ncbi:MAG: polyphosphate kinase 2 family protein [Gemmatimonadetes bacterium]|nr:polyphosphate kinase 2 family protein [Gemmatimonadota bacterium]
MKRAFDTDSLRVRPGTPVQLEEWPTRVKPLWKSKKQYHEQLERGVEELSDLQRLHFASDRYALLLILQGMDASGKDGVIRHVMSGVNPQGCQVASFKAPSAEESAHDFLWRTSRALPERGQIGIFNRSYYEEVLIVRVHPELLSPQRLPNEPSGGERLWKDRFRSIVEHEEHLHRSGTRIIKCFLHMSKEEQAARFRDRIDDARKNWKFSESDILERKSWPHYMQAYAACMTATSSAHAPWYIVPADDKKNARLMVSRIVRETLHALRLTVPTTTASRRAELAAFRERL